MVRPAFHLLRVQVVEQVLDVCPAKGTLTRFVLPLEPRVLDQIREMLGKIVGDFVQGRRVNGNVTLGVHFVSITPDMVVTVALSGPPMSEPSGICSLGIQVFTSLSCSPLALRRTNLQPRARYPFY